MDHKKFGLCRIRIYFWQETDHLRTGKNSRNKGNEYRLEGKEIAVRVCDGKFQIF